MAQRDAKPCLLPARRPAAQRGVTLIIALAALTIVLVSGVALIKSFNTSLLLSGHLGFKRDLNNQAERGVAKAMASFSSGALADEAARQMNHGPSNYSAAVLSSDSRGIPSALISDPDFAAAGMAAADLADAASGVTIRYVIDRQCAAAGAFDEAACISSFAVTDRAGTSWVKRAGGSARALYRITVKVSGPRHTETYLQTLIAI